MSLSPRGSSAVVHGNPVKGWTIMLIGGVLAWISGQSWSTGTGFGELFSLLMAYSTLAALAVPATLVAGRASRPGMLAVAGMLGMTVPSFFDLAIEFQGQGIWGTSALILGSSLLVTFVASWTTRALMRWSERHPT